MAEWKKLRNYEISVWTLQDNYITTLKSGDPLLVSESSLPAVLWPQARAQGQIQNGLMEINIDGTLNLSFDIPMYLYTNGEKIENPNWYSTVNKNILTSMRKIKVIFNKWQLDYDNTSSVFEFIIHKVQETHEKDNLICHVECEGLAFNELGKVGYKRSLSTDEFNNDYYEWSIATIGSGADYKYNSEEEKSAAEPHANLLYWLSKAKIDPQPENINEINPTKWYYKILMSHTSLAYDEVVYDDKIYEEGFPVDWTDEGVPVNFIKTREKYRLVDINESNLYNITLDLAEKFGVFCRYEYTYDNNYNIIGRTIIFYNNFLQEGKDVVTLMYPNSVSKVSREMDSNDISTKMFIRSVDADDLYTGVLSIMNCNANKSKEDYLLNFDYLHEIGTISDELYKEISKYEKAMRKCNNAITPLLEAYSNLLNIKTEVDAKVKILEESITLDEERKQEYVDIIYGIDVQDGDNDGYVTRDYRNPKILSLIKDTSNTEYDSYYVLFNSDDENMGVVPETLKLYETYNTTTTTEKAYAIGFYPYHLESIETKNSLKMHIDLPGLHFSYINNSKTIEWFNFQLIYKGLIGNVISTLPSNPSNNDAYLVLELNYPKSYLVEVGQWLLYNSTSSKWEVKNSVGNSYKKGSIGSTASDVVALPGSPELGWIYRVLVNNYSVTGLGTLTAGTLCIYTEAGWKTLVIPSGHEYGRGFYLFNRERTKLVNGITTEVYTSSHLKYDSAYGRDYIKKVRRLFYTTTNTSLNSVSLPLNETATTEATKISSKNTLDTWTSCISLPENPETTAYKIFTCIEITNTNDSSIKTFLSRSGYITTDVEGNVIADLVAGASATALVNEVKGQFSYDEYGNLTKVSGLFPRIKTGDYKTYGITEAIASSNANTISKVNTVITTLNNVAKSSKTPTNVLNKTVVIKTKHLYSNGNIAYSYLLKYYDENKINTSPGNNYVKSITPIFYLKTTNPNTAPSAPTKQTVSNEKVLNHWTTIMPDKTNNTWAYYSGYIVTSFASNSESYYMKSGADTSLKAKVSNIASTDTIPKYLYATYKFKPDLYYESIRDFWANKLATDNDDLAKYKDRQLSLENLIEKVKEELDEKIDDKDRKVAAFERMMGAALRESYWQPEDEYLDYGTKYIEDLDLLMENMSTVRDSTFFRNTTDEYLALMGWDNVCYSDELKIYYTSGVDLTKIYYPCIDLTLLTENMAGSEESFLGTYLNEILSDLDTAPFAFFFNPVMETIPLNENESDLRYCEYYVIGSLALFAFIQSGSVIKPVLLLTGASSLSNTALLNMYKTGRIGLLTTTRDDNKVILSMDTNMTYTIPDGAWLNATKSGDTWNLKTTISYKLMYPRILIPSLNLKTDAKNLVLKYGQLTLTNYEDYYILTLTYYNDASANISANEKSYKKFGFNNLEILDTTKLSNTNKFETYYTITIKPEYLFKHVSNLESAVNIAIKAYYAISNADIDIYLDAKDILKENAYPKVSYEVEVNKWSQTLLENIHTKLAQLVMINDYDLKLLNTFGYISSVKLDLDHEEKDSIEVKNYKTKFEDLFSKIVAETEEMHKNSRNIGLAGALGAADGVDVMIGTEGFYNTINNVSNQELLKKFLDEYFDGPEVVLNLLKDVFNEAGQILGSAASSLNKVMGLTTENASILAGFRENVVATMTPNVYTGPSKPSGFKPGDIWLTDTGDTYVATGYDRNGYGGFTRTHDGSLAEITGANVSFDAETGKVDIYGEFSIDMRSGKDIYIAADDTVNIVGNKEVNIGGTTINIASSNIIGDGFPGKIGKGGIHLVATQYIYDSSAENSLTVATNGISRVDIDGNGIEMASKNGIIIKSGAGISLQSSTDISASALTIDHEKGIWIGSDKTISLFSGTGDEIGNNASGASVELSKDHLIFGFADVATASATAMELSKELIILAAGSKLNDIHNINTQITADNSTLSGLQIRAGYIGMAAVSNNIRSIFSLVPGEIKLGTMSKISGHAGTEPEDYEGSFLWIKKGDVYIGSLGHFTLNTNNIKILTKLMENYTTTDIDSSSDATLSTDVAKMGFALGKNLLNTYVAPAANATALLIAALEATNPFVGLGFWIDDNNNTHLVVDGTIRARSFTLLDDGALTITYSYAYSVGMNLPADNAFTAQKPDLDTYANSLSESNKGKIYLWTRTTLTIGGKSVHTYRAEHINADGTTATTLIDYTTWDAASLTSSQIASLTWYNTVASATAAANGNKFLVTRVRTYNGSSWDTKYTFAKLVDDPESKIYPESIQVIYLLVLPDNNNTITVPSMPGNTVDGYTATQLTRSNNANDGITSNDYNRTNQWIIGVPKYTTGCKGRYYKCTQTKWAGRTDYIWEWTGLARDSGLTIAALYATDASVAAADAANAAEPITAYGIIGKDDPDYTHKNTGQKGTNDPTTLPGNISWSDMVGYPMWNNTTYGLILGNNLPLPMLIGGNNGVTIVDTNGASGNGAAIVLKGGGIAFHGATINFTAQSTWGTTTVAMNEEGLNLGGAKLKIDISRTFNTSNHSRFYLNTDELDPSTRTSSTNMPVFTMHNGTNWNNATQGINFNIDSGLIVKGNIIANSFLIASSLNFTIDGDDFNTRVSTIAQGVANGSSPFTISGLSGNYRKYDADKDDLPNGVTFENIPVFNHNNSYTTDTWVYNSTKEYVYKFISPHTAGDAWDRSELDIEYRRTVEVTSETALVLGANSGIYVLRNNSSALKPGTTDTSQLTYLAIDKSKLNLDFNANNYIHMSSSGIDVKGSRININGDDVWARDDIIVMSSNPNHWSYTIANVEKYMKGQTVTIGNNTYTRSSAATNDWVVIKPYYTINRPYEDASSNNTNGYKTYGSIDWNTPVLTVIPVNGGYNAVDYLGNDSETTYTYELEFDAKINLAGGSTSSTNVTQVNIGLKAGTGNGTVEASYVYSPLTGGYTVNPLDSIFENLTSINFAGSGTKHCKCTIRSSTNLCSENHSNNLLVYVAISTNAYANDPQEYNRTYIYNVTLNVSTGGTTGKRVPCNVYYYLAGSV